MLRFKEYNETHTLSEGGGFGHLSHPYDIDFTFNEIKGIIVRAFQGRLEQVTEKTDGQNLMFSWKNNKLIASRNKGHQKNFGENALDKAGIVAKFSGRGALLKAYSDVMDELSHAISQLSATDKEYFFDEGHKWISIEVMVPENENIVHYGVSEVRFHGTIELGEDGNPISKLNQSDGRYLEKILRNKGLSKGERFEFKGLSKVKIGAMKNHKKRTDKYLIKLNKVMKSQGVKNSDKLSAYKTNYIRNKVIKNVEMPLEVEQALVSRWAHNVKSLSITNIYKMVPELKSWIQKTDKSMQKVWKEMMHPIENIFLGVGAELMKTISSMMTVNPDKSMRKIADNMWDSVNKIKASDNEGLKKTLDAQLKKLDALGGIESLMPTEGITFFYKGELLKLTGVFAPVNQITNLVWRL